MPDHLSRQKIGKVAGLALLQLTEREQKEFSGQLDKVVVFIEELQSVDTEGIPPTSHAMRVEHVLREDVVTPSLPREKAMQFASVTQDDCFVVPAVMAGRKGGKSL